MDMGYTDKLKAMKADATAEMAGKFYEMAGGKKPSEMTSEDIWGPVQITGSKPVESTVYSGKGGYEYVKLPDGSFLISQSPRGGAGTVVSAGSRAHTAIKNEVDKLHAERTSSVQKPRSAAAPKAVAPKSVAPPAAPKVRGRPNAASMQSMQEPGNPRMGRSMRDEYRGGMSEDAYSPAEKTYNEAALSTRALNALVREGTAPMAASKIVQGLTQSGNRASLEGLARLRK